MKLLKITGARRYRMGVAVGYGARPAEADHVVAIDQRGVHAGA